ncbi:50S ribosomal protein L33 [Candidatus Vidania fulgoroideorum]
MKKKQKKNIRIIESINDSKEKYSIKTKKNNLSLKKYDKKIRKHINFLVIK